MQRPLILVQELEELLEVRDTSREMILPPPQKVTAETTSSIFKLMTSVVLQKESKKSDVEFGGVSMEKASFGYLII